MRILFLTNSSYRFPIPRIHIMAEYLAEEGYDVTVICNENKTYTHNGVKIVGITKHHNMFKHSHHLNFKAYLKAWKNEKINPDIVQVFTPFLLPLGVHIKKLTGAKLLYDCYEPWIQGSLAEGKLHSAILHLILHKFSSRYVDGVTYVYDKNPTLNVFTTPRRLWFPNILKDEYYIKALKKEVRDKKNPAEFRVCYLGNITRLKGYPTVIEALNYLDSNYRLWLLGNFADNTMRTKILNMINKYNLQNRVFISGYIERYEDLLAMAHQCDVGLVFPEDTGWQRYTLPAKLFDYMALGVPIIASDLPNLKEFLGKCKCGITVNHSPKNLARTIIYIRENCKLRKLFRNNGKNIFWKNFSEKKLKKNLLDFYSEVIV